MLSGVSTVEVPLEGPGSVVGESDLDKVMELWKLRRGPRRGRGHTREEVGRWCHYVFV